nr:adenine deaminase [Quercus suber]
MKYSTVRSEINADVRSWIEKRDDADGLSCFKPANAFTTFRHRLITGTRFASKIPRYGMRSRPSQISSRRFCKEGRTRRTMLYCTNLSHSSTMCRSSIHSLLQALPKCEHHLHLEGALTPAVLFELASKNKITLPGDDAAFASPEALKERYNHFTSLDDFLHYYYIGMSVLVDASDFEALAWDYLQRAASDGVMHAEMFFDPQAHLSRGIGYDVVLSGFSAARQRAIQQLGVTSELICCFLRHLPAPECLQTFELAEIQASFKAGEVIGIGLDSSESPFPPELFKDIYQKAKALGLRLTAHAGEEGPSTYVRSALDTLEVERIDHGIRLAEDDELLARVAKEGTMLSVCPLSNVLLRCVGSVAELPIRKFLDLGVQFSINSDDPAYFGGNYILDNYCAVQDAFHLCVVEWRSICAASIRGSWCSEARKQEMLLKLQEVVDQWTAANPA